MSQYKALLAQAAELEAKIAAARKQESGAALEEIRARVAEFGFTVDDVFGKKRMTKAATPLYRDPATGTTWSGRGREPGWLRGKHRDDFAIKD